MKWLLLLPLLLVACNTAAPLRPSLQEQVDYLHAQVLSLQDKVTAGEVRSCKALYIAWATGVKAGWVEDRALDDALPGCPKWSELQEVTP